MGWKSLQTRAGKAEACKYLWLGWRYNTVDQNTCLAHDWPGFPSQYHIWNQEQFSGVIPEHKNRSNPREPADVTQYNIYVCYMFVWIKIIAFVLIMLMRANLHFVIIMRVFAWKSNYVCILLLTRIMSSRYY